MVGSGINQANQQESSHQLQNEHRPDPNCSIHLSRAHRALLLLSLLSTENKAKLQAVQIYRAKR